ncbi:hypothetical protein [Allokutzneria albata]|uniref:hypothetical protein n=1 Tax=Allokutzneria albata TaxID=211114 RepID=UPI0004C2F0A6|nr:hypothetical protein [Allokutzneria albata]
MKLYADQAGRRAGQLLADVAAVTVMVFAVIGATRLYENVLKLRMPGDKLTESGSVLRGVFAGAAEWAARIPLVGESLAKAFTPGVDAGDQLVAAGGRQIDAVEQTGLWLALVVVLLPLVLLLATWLPWRIRFIREASAAVALLRHGDARELLAARAIANLPLKHLSNADAVAWRNGELDALAERELVRLGLRPRRQ